MTFIYSLSDPNTNEIRYIGKANDPINRYRVHLSRSRTYFGKSHLYNWIRSLKDKPILSIIEEVDDSIWQERERYWISLYDNLCNMTTGGEGLCNIKWSKEQIDIIYKSRRERIRSPEERDKHRAHIPWNKGKKCGHLSEEHKMKLSLSMKGTPKQKVTCPYCNKSGGISAMKQRHFERCKNYNANCNNQ